LKVSSKTKVAIAAFFLSLMLLAISIEALCSVVLIHYYRRTGVLNDGKSQFSALVVIENVLGRFGISSIPQAAPAAYEFSHSSEPAPFYRADDILGYAANVGTFKHIFKRRKRTQQKWELFPVKVTINSDGSRWTGKSYNAVGHPNIFVFGGSTAVGYGVNDEQTFAYLLQAANPDSNVHLFALGGWGLGQAYLRFEQLKDRISADDIIIIGYDDSLDARNVVAPSHIRQMERWVKRMIPDAASEIPKVPRATIGPDGNVAFELIGRSCEVSNCNAADPSQEYMTEISARLINEIAETTPAKVYVVHLGGSKNNRLFEKLDKRVEVISALHDDFGYFIRDDIEGFDRHPGPYWNYAISRLLIDRLK
jgi:hypothetical protein